MRMSQTNQLAGGAGHDSTRQAAIAAAEAMLDDGTLFRDLSLGIACRTESQRSDSRTELRAYLTDLIVPHLKPLGFVCRIVEHAEAKGPFLIARRQEDETFPTVMCYGHGDVV